MIASKTVLKSAALLFVITTFFIACDKRQQETKLQHDSDIASIGPVNTSDTIYGNYGNPRVTPSNYGAVYVNLSSSTFSRSTTLDTSHDIKLYLTNNSFVAGVNGYQVTYVQEPSIPFASLVKGDFPSTNVDSIGRTIPPAVVGWYSYTAQNNLSLTPNFYILARHATKQSYAIRFTYGGGDGTATSNRGKYIIQGGPISN